MPHVQCRITKLGPKKKELSLSQLMLYASHFKGDNLAERTARVVELETNYIDLSLSWEADSSQIV